jgi:hypothetical protein
MHLDLDIRGALEYDRIDALVISDRSIAVSKAVLDYLGSIGRREERAGERTVVSQKQVPVFGEAPHGRKLNTISCNPSIPVLQKTHAGWRLLARASLDRTAKPDNSKEKMVAPSFQKWPTQGRGNESKWKWVEDIAQPPICTPRCKEQVGAVQCR